MNRVDRWLTAGCVALALYVLSGTVPRDGHVLPVDAEPVVLTPPAIPVPVPDPGPVTDEDVVTLVCTDHGPPMPPPPTSCPDVDTGG